MKARFHPTPLFAVLIIAGVAGLAYSNTLGAPFIFDDVPSIVNNVSLRSWGGSWRPPSEHGMTTSGRPLLNFSFALNYALSGTRVWSYHALNSFIHALGGITLFGIIRRTLLMPKMSAVYGRYATELALVIALIWTVHPLQTEAVTYVVQRAESLAALFYLLTLWCYLRSLESVHSLGWRLAAIGACVAGMATKEMVFSAPLMVALYDRVFVTTSWRETWRQRRVLLGGLAATWIVLAFLITSTGGRGGTAGFGTSISALDSLWFQGGAIARYLQLSLWPVGLVFDYGRLTAHEVALVNVPALAVVALLAAGSAWAAVRGAAAGFAGIFFFAVLAPSSSFVPIVTQGMSEHRMYLPLAAVIAFAVLGVFRWSGSRLTWVVLPLILALGTTTWWRNRAYRDAESIWSDTVAKREGNSRAQNNLALELQKQGRRAEANAHFARAGEIDPDYAQALSNWGAALTVEGNLPEAIGHLERAVQLAPAFPDAQVNLGNALVKAGRAVEAIAHYEAAARLQAGADIFFNLGIALTEVGRDAEAAKNFRAALRENPQLAAAHFQLGRIAERAGAPAAAVSEFEHAVNSAPDLLEARRKLGLLYAKAERLSEAEVQFRAVVAGEPGDADAFANLGNVLLLQEKFPAAIASYEASLRLRPNDVRTAANLKVAREAMR